MRKEFLFLIILFSFFSGNFALAAGRPLEVNYPNIGLTAVPTSTSVTLPQYLEYIFRWSVSMIGLVVFGVIVYSGVKYLLSAGDPSKLKDAKDGIISALLGAIILLGAFIIFNTINPQLVIFELEKIKPVPSPVGSILAGVYLCNYNTDGIWTEGTTTIVIDIKQILADYTSDNKETQIEATEKIKALLKTAQSGVTFAQLPKLCIGPLKSGNFGRRDFLFHKDATNNTWFIIPSKEYDFGTKKYVWKYNVGFVLHESDKRDGQCRVFPNKDFSGQDTSEGKFINPVDCVSTQIAPGITLSCSYHTQLDRDAHSISVFQITSPIEDGKVTLYYEPNYNKDVMEGTNPTSSVFTLNQTNEIKKVSENELGPLVENTRSIEIEPKDSYFVLMFEHKDADNASGDNTSCGIIMNNVNNLPGLEIGHCAHCTIPSDKPPKRCPCIHSMYIVKGKTF